MTADLAVAFSTVFYNVFFTSLPLWATRPFDFSEQEGVRRFSFGEIRSGVLVSRWVGFNKLTKVRGFGRIE